MKDLGRKKPLGAGKDPGEVKTTFHSGLKNDDVQTSSSQVIGAAKVFDAFGNELSSTGSWKSQFGYAGKFGYQQDADSGLKLLGHRYYDSSTGRFLTRDPIKDGRNWYSYCDNNPVSRVDPNGLKYHDPTTVGVFEEFKGRVTAFGDFSYKGGDYWRDIVIVPGYETNPNMDVDMLKIEFFDEDGKVIRTEWWFLPGANSNADDGKEVRSYYYVDEKGRVVAVGNALPAYQVGTTVWILVGPIPTPVVTWWPHWTWWIEDAEKTGYPTKRSPLVRRRP